MSAKPSARSRPPGARPPESAASWPPSTSSCAASADAPGGASALADELEVDPGYELALAAALDGRLRAALVADRGAGSELLDRAGADGGRALVAPGGDVPTPPATSTAPTPDAQRLSDRVRGKAPAVALARALLRDTWVVGSLDDVPESFGGVAVTAVGRVWSAPSREVRQAPALGEERVLAERNRREQLIAASEAAAQAEVAAAAGLERAAADSAGVESGSRTGGPGSPACGPHPRRGRRGAPADRGDDRASPGRARRGSRRGPPRCS